MNRERDKPAPDGAKGGPTPEHARWVRAHPSVGSSPFPEYPDDEARRGASRGSVANGNPWRAESSADVPGRAPLEGIDLTAEERASLAALKDAADPTPAPSAAAVAAERALAADPELGQRNLRVVAEGAGLAVHGRVASHAERERALVIVTASAGLDWVEDCLDVLGGIRPDG